LFFLGAVDIANNRRDNLNNFHDVMKSFRWEVRTLAFFMGIAEANAFSAFQRYNQRGASLHHSEFKSELADGILQYVADQEGREQQQKADRMRTRGMDIHISTSLGLTGGGLRKRRVCNGGCGNRTINRCSCTLDIALCRDCQQKHVQEVLVDQMHL
jgi:hypothetical protein